LDLSLSFIFKEEVKMFHDKLKLNNLFALKQHFRIYSKKLYTWKKKINATMKIWQKIYPKRKAYEQMKSRDELKTTKSAKIVGIST
jgi:flagellar biosynthesis chaperone FliJ